MMIIIMTMMMMSSTINWQNNQTAHSTIGSSQRYISLLFFCPTVSLATFGEYPSESDITWLPSISMEWSVNCSALGWQWSKCTNILCYIATLLHCYIAAFPLRLTLTGLNLLLNSCILHCCDSRCAALLDSSLRRWMAALSLGANRVHCNCIALCYVVLHNCHWEPTVCSSSPSQLCSTI